MLKLSHVLFISCVLCTAKGINEGCVDYNLAEDGLVCCIRCMPGHHLVKQCGPDPNELCIPCGPNTFSVKPLSWRCSRCSQCIDPQVELRVCNASANTVCGCKAGLRCGDEQCTYCTDECKEGEEPTKKRSCRKCPEGTFNNKIHSTCKSWRESCPEGEVLTANGNAFSDIKCSRMPMTSIPNELSINDVLPVRKKTPDEPIWPVGVIVGGIFAAFVVFILSLWLTTQRRTATKKATEHNKPVAETLQKELTIMMVEHDEACSFHQPEQEHGGSSETISTQDSESKLIV